MPYEQLQANTVRTHSLTLEGRNRLNISGVQDVAGFDENLVILTTAEGNLNIRGQQLHIERIDLDSGELRLQGLVQELSYDEPSRSGSLWSRLFG